MSDYIEKADIEDVFGKDNVATWSNLDGDPGADATRIATAISVAEEDVNNRFRGGKYSIPLAPVSDIVKNWCARLAGIWLFENRPSFNKSETQKEGFQDMKDGVDSEVEMYTSGQRVLPCTLASDVYGMGPVAV
jgi:phage gp36-like protein